MQSLSIYLLLHVYLFFHIELLEPTSASSKMPGWMKYKLESRLLGEIAITSDMLITPSLWQRQRGTTESLESKRGEWKRWLKAQHSKNLCVFINRHYLLANTFVSTLKKSLYFTNKYFNVYLLRTKITFYIKIVCAYFSII